MIKVESKVDVLEIDGGDLPINDDTAIIVRSHCGRNDLVILEIDGKRFSVDAKDMGAAISNAVNVSRY